MLRQSVALFVNTFGMQRVGMKRANLSLHVDSSMSVVDPFVPPARFSVPPWRDAKKRWFNASQSYLWANRIAMALTDQRRIAAGKAPKRIMSMQRKFAITLQLLVPRLFGFWKHRFARTEASELYLRLLEAHARGDTALLKTLASDSYCRTLSSDIKSRKPLPRGVSLEFSGSVRSARAVNVRCVMNPRPVVEFAQVLVLFRMTQTVSVVRAPTTPDQPPTVLSRQVRDVEDVIAFERNLLDSKATWLVLDRVRSTVLSDRNEIDKVG
jgi:hypothetical protein